MPVNENITLALIAAVPPTLAAAAALLQVRRLSTPLREVNAAVNHRTPGQRRLVEMVDDIAAELTQMRGELSRHQAWHQLQDEFDDEDGL